MATIRVFLNPDVLKVDGYKPRQGMEQDGGSFPGVRIDTDEGRIYTDRKEGGLLPVYLQPYVLGFRVREVFSAVAHREIGLYGDKTATGKLDTFDSPIIEAETRYEAIIDAPNPGDALELLKRIRLGTIRPLPGMSYEQEQVSSGKTYAELEAELNGLKADLRTYLRDSNWWFYAKTTIFDKITAILKNYE